MNTQQPEWQFLSELFELESDHESVYRRAATELRRLHEANQELEHKVNLWRTEAVLWSKECIKHKSVSAELLEALNLIANTGKDAKQCRDYAISAIAKAQE